MNTPEFKIVRIDDLIPYAENARIHDDAQVAEIAASITEFGFINPVVVAADNPLVAGHGRVLAAKRLGLETVPAVDASWLTPAQVEAYRLADNKIAENSTWDTNLLKVTLGKLRAAAFDLSLTGFRPGEVDLMFKLGGDIGKTSASLAERFGVPPFSVLNAREGWWQERKAAWLSLGIRSEVGRGTEGALTYTKGKKGTDKLDPVSAKILANRPDGSAGEDRGTSIFDPVLCELAVRWFCPGAGAILDPFAGGSVRGVVASRLGRPYVGIELRPEQVDSNREQGRDICPDTVPEWIVGDSMAIDDLVGDRMFDMLFTCPPYADLEVYSDDARDLSTMEYTKFASAYAEIIRRAATRLNDDRFVVIVVGEARGKSGGYYGFVPDTVKACQAAGLTYYNEMILVTAVGSLAVRAGRQMELSRKVGKAHQNALVFVKGNPKRATKACGKVEFGVLTE